MHRELLTIHQAAAQLGCHPATVRRRIAEGALTAYRVGPRSIRIDSAELEQLLRQVPAAQPA